MGQILSDTKKKKGVVETRLCKLLSLFVAPGARNVKANHFPHAYI
jgi:hypothetical protein